MGNMCTTRFSQSYTEEEKKAQIRIDHQIRLERQKQDAEIKLLLLGTGDSGKSTIAKQMKILHLNGYSEQELINYRIDIHSYIVLATRTLVLGAKGLDLQFLSENEPIVTSLSNDFILQDHNLSDVLGKQIEHLVNDPAMIKFLENTSLVSDTIKYFYQNLLRIRSPGYVPIMEDILRLRIKTTGVHEILFHVQNYFFRMVDVGGQRSERRKWIHCFEGVKAILFCVALNEYDMRLFEDESINRMHESMKLFDEVCNCRYFINTSIVLLLNKEDLFRAKIGTSDLKQCFHEYDGGSDADVAIKYITDQFKNLNSLVKTRRIYCHTSTATSTDSVRLVFRDVMDILLQNMMDTMRL
eukprot:TRINITY_DN10819_c0_g1_i1.p1 TRINITY_DN10819_c0_g1~~TRINITY_DN10819_c0_g1_i1.p1  ORF type:complete len:368 (+),score=68.57 TRINITY_DN10819_c0_g1_i1:42-1106(+)